MSSSQFARFDPGPILEDFDSNEEDGMQLDDPKRILRIAVDFGTTFSSVAYASTPELNYLMRLHDVACIARYPGDSPIPMNTGVWEPRQDVPTELLYTVINNRSKSLRKSTQNVPDMIQSDHEIPSDSDDSSEMSIDNFDTENGPDDPASTAHPELPNRAETLAWGFEVYKRLLVEDDVNKEDRHITKTKLLLDEPRQEQQEIQQVVSTTRKKLKKLRTQKLIGPESDSITHYLRKLLTHVKDELEQAGRWDAGANIEYILCVPAVWPSKACRIMQQSMAQAVRSSGLGGVSNDELDNLFIVSEPEAAATCIMAEQGNGLLAGETIVVIDAGGGTVDAITYLITNSNPLRVSAEVVPPKTESCGAGYVNEEYKKFLLKKLRKETYLEKNGKTIESIVARELLRFENTEKRIWNSYDPSRNIDPIWIDDLRAGPPNSRIRQNQLKITREDVYKIYRYSLKGTADVLQDQLQLAKAGGHSVHRILLTGGFGQSPCLQSHLRLFLSRPENYNLDNERVELLVPRAASTAVARGAVLRASNKSLGPDRISSCSYGFMRSEPWEPELCPAHKGVKPDFDKIDGERYVFDTIDWLFKRGETLEVGREKSIIARHMFTLNTAKFVCKEYLYVSDDYKESHYSKRNAMNRGAEQAGSIVVDMTFVKDHGLEPQPVSDSSTWHPKGKKVWVVEFELVMRVDGRNLFYEARWPVKQPGQDMSTAKAVVLEKGQVCIAATFKPGTA